MFETMGDVTKSFLDAWCGKNKITPTYEVRGSKQRQRFLCEVRVPGFDYVGIGDSTNNTDAQTNAARDFLLYLVRAGKISQAEVPIEFPVQNPGLQNPGPSRLLSSVLQPPYIPSFSEERHDPTRTKAPGHKMEIKYHDESVGYEYDPANYDTQTVTNMSKEYNRTPTMGKAVRFHDTGVTSPGPAAYTREEGDSSVYHRAPSYSMSHSQRSEMRPSGTPACNSYSLPTSFGPGNTNDVNGPSYSMGKAKREEFTLKQQSPGPAAYQLPSSNVNMNKAPAFYMGRTLPPFTDSSPGPAAHAAHMVKYDEHNTPGITYGIYRTPYKAPPGFAAEN